jgi:hypothetical protein
MDGLRRCRGRVPQYLSTIGKHHTSKQVCI